MNALHWLTGVQSLAILGYVLTGFFKKRDAHRELALKLANIASHLGLVRTPELLQLFATGQYVKLVHKLKDFVEMLEHPTERDLELKGVLERLLKEQLDNPDTLLVIEKQIAEARKRHTDDAKSWLPPAPAPQPKPAVPTA